MNLCKRVPVNYIIVDQFTIDSVFSKNGIPQLQSMTETGDFREMLKLARDDISALNKLWCLTYLIGELNSLSMCLPDVIYRVTRAYMYGKL